MKKNNRSIKTLLLFLFTFHFVFSQQSITIVDVDNNPINDVVVFNASSNLVSISNAKGIVIVENKDFPIILTKNNYETLKLESYQNKCVLTPKIKEIAAITVKPLNKLKMLEGYLKKSIDFSSKTSDTVTGYYFAKSILVYNYKDTNYVEGMCKIMLIKNKHDEYEIYVSEAKKAIKKQTIGKDDSVFLNMGVFLNFKRMINAFNQKKLKQFNLTKKNYANNDINISENSSLTFNCSSKKIVVKNKKTYVFDDSLLVNYTSEFYDTLGRTDKFVVLLKDKIAIDYTRESLSFNRVFWEKNLLFSKIPFNPTLKSFATFEKMGFVAIDSLKMNNMQKVDDLQEYFKTLTFDSNFSINYQFE